MALYYAKLCTNATLTKSYPSRDDLEQVRSSSWTTRNTNGRQRMNPKNRSSDLNFFQNWQVRPLLSGPTPMSRSLTNPGRDYCLCAPQLQSTVKPFSSGPTRYRIGHYKPRFPATLSDREREFRIILGQPSISTVGKRCSRISPPSLITSSIRKSRLLPTRFWLTNPTRTRL